MTVEEYYLSKIKEVLQFGNDAQAIRFLEKYFEAKQTSDISNKSQELKVKVTTKS
jgi:uncharacterized glyoxalase superfamily protein PhnB